MNRKQLSIFFVLLVVYILCVFVTYTFFLDQLTETAGMTMPELNVPPYVLGLANAGIILVAYGLLGLAGYWFARKLELPGIYSEDGNWRRWVLIPLGLGFICGLAIIAMDMIFAPIQWIWAYTAPRIPVVHHRLGAPQEEIEEKSAPYAKAIKMKQLPCAFTAFPIQDFNVPDDRQAFTTFVSEAATPTKEQSKGAPSLRRRNRQNGNSCVLHPDGAWLHKRRIH